MYIIIIAYTCMSMHIEVYARVSITFKLFNQVVRSMFKSYK